MRTAASGKGRGNQGAASPEGTMLPYPDSMPALVLQKGAIIEMLER